jgi:hypothetical protein
LLSTRFVKYLTDCRAKGSDIAYSKGHCARGALDGIAGDYWQPSVQGFANA